MFSLFYSLYVALFTGSWQNYSFNQIGGTIKNGLNQLVLVLTTIFNEGTNPVSDFGSNFSQEDLVFIVSLVLATITTIGVVTAVVNIIKRIFTIFFQGVR